MHTDPVRIGAVLAALVIGTSVQAVVVGVVMLIGRSRKKPGSQPYNPPTPTAIDLY
jgi:multisubunit Na+/H+ antiporter MnhC subunit